MNYPYASLYNDLTPVLSYKEREHISSPVGVHPEGRVREGVSFFNNN